jgi:hypothetical protein
MITLKICGRLYGGSSIVNDDGSPFKSVHDRNFVTMSDAATAATMINVIINAQAIVCKYFLVSGDWFVVDIEDIKNRLTNVIIAGNLPLHGMKLFVSIDIMRSRGESIMRLPTMPQALHPNPMHIVSACLPQAWQRWNAWSRLNAIRGR